MQAIVGANTYHTMRVIGKVKRNPLHILVDSGSTHNFLNLTTAKKNLIVKSKTQFPYKFMLQMKTHRLAHPCVRVLHGPYIEKSFKKT